MACSCFNSQFGKLLNVGAGLARESEGCLWSRARPAPTRAGMFYINSNGG